MSSYHQSVLLKEAVEALQVKKGFKYIDATFGGGGHAVEIARRGGFVLGIDVDSDAIKNFETHTPELDAEIKSRIKVVQGNFADIDEIAKKNGFDTVDGILFDLGVSSYQFDTTERGFSFQRESMLDMRMDMSLGVTASDLINGLTRKELIMLFEKYGEEHFARKIAEAITNARNVKKITTTTQLAGVIERAVGRREKIHPATRVFQALRIAVNDELFSLETALGKSVSLLKSAGKLAVISFHSLEDRIVKRSFLDFADRGLGSIITQKPLIPSDLEIRENPRARSAKLRVFAKK